MNRRRTFSTVVTAAVLLVAMAVPSHGVTSWLTRANVTGQGAGDLTTTSAVMVTLPKPHAIRIGVATPKDVSKRALVDWFVECENGFIKQDTKRVQTATDGSLTWLTVQDGSKDLGRACTVGAFGALTNTTKLRTVVQYKGK